MNTRASVTAGYAKEVEAVLALLPKLCAKAEGDVSFCVDTGETFGLLRAQRSWKKHADRDDDDPVADHGRRDRGFQGARC